MAVQDLAILLRSTEPVPHPEPHGNGDWTGAVLQIKPFGTVAEVEGLSVVAPLTELQAAVFVTALGRLSNA